MEDKKSIKINNSGPCISVGILAGGLSSRMGQDKALIRLGNERIIERISKELSGFSEVVISAGSKGAYEEFGCPVVNDEEHGRGPIEGIRQLLSNAKEDHVFICAADMPNIKSEIVSYLAGYISSDYDCYVIADEDHIEPLCAVYSKRILPVIEALIREGSFRLREIFDRVRTKYISLEYTCFDKSVVKNINTRQELFDAIKPVVFCVSGYSDSGKTGLIVKLINEFIKDGMSVGVIKHDGHDSFADAPGSDTDRFMKAGAVCTAVYSDTRHMEYYARGAESDEMADRFRRLKAPPDVVIIEGLKGESYPKIEVIREAVCGRSVCDPDSLICIAADCISPDSVSCPVFRADDIEGIYLCVKKFFDVF